MKTKTKKTLNLAPNGGRRQGYQVQLNQNEADVIDTAAARIGQTRGAFMRQASIEKATGVRL